MTIQDQIASQVRRRLEDRLGSAFAAKASDALCLSMASAGASLESSPGAFAPEAAGGQPLAPQPIILEMDNQSQIEEGRSRLQSFESLLAGRLGAMPEAVPDSERRRMGDHLRRAVRTSASEDMRRRFEAMSRSIRERLERSASAGVDLEGSEPELAGPFVDVCWINGTANVASFTPALAEVAASDEIIALDTPRRLVREVDETVTLIGGAAFRDSFHVGGAGVIVAVIDSEIDHLHPRYGGRVQQKENYTGEVWGSPGNHGTAVAGIIHDIAPETTIWNYKIFAQKWWLDSNDFGGSKAIQQALEDGAHVANCSWGAGPAGDGTSREARACNTAWSYGLTLVKSAGNAGPGSGTLTTPADADGILVVGATDRTGRTLGTYSSRGPTGHGLERPHLVAPGGLPGLGSGIRSTLPNNRFGEAEDGTSFGTSYAAPHVSAAIALLLERDGELTPDDIRARLIACCSPLAGVGVDEQGAGLLDLLTLKPPA